MNSRMRAFRTYIWNAVYEKKRRTRLYRVLLFLCDSLQILFYRPVVIERVADDAAALLTANGSKGAPGLILHPYFRAGSQVVTELRRQIRVPPFVLSRPCITQHEVVEFL